MNKKSCLQKLLVAVVLFITNYLPCKKQRYKDGESHLSKLKSNEFATRTLKKDYDFLKEIDKFGVINKE